MDTVISGQQTQSYQGDGDRRSCQGVRHSHIRGTDRDISERQTQSYQGDSHIRVTDTVMSGGQACQGDRHSRIRVTDSHVRLLASHIRGTVSHIWVCMKALSEPERRETGGRGTGKQAVNRPPRPLRPSAPGTHASMEVWGRQRSRGWTDVIGAPAVSPLEGLMLKLKLQYLGHLIRRADSLEETLMLGGIEGRRRRDDRG